MILFGLPSTIRRSTASCWGVSELSRPVDAPRPSAPSAPSAGAVATRSAAGAGGRLGRASRCRQVLLEDLARGLVAEAAARGVVEPVGEPAEAGARERLGRALAWQEAADPAVQVLDAALLPGGVRVAEVGLHREVAVEGGVAGELAAAVEGDGPAGLLGQR